MLHGRIGRRAGRVDRAPAGRGHPRVRVWHPFPIGATAVALLALTLLGHGIMDLTRGTPIEVVGGAGTDAARPAAAEPAFAVMIAHLAELRLATGNEVEILLDGAGTFPRLWADLAGARRSIAFQVYFCRAGAVADTLAEILAERARAGVRVRLLADGFGCAELVDAYGERLRDAGVQIAVFRPVHWHTLHKAQHRSHARAVVIDGRIGYTGGFGIADEWYGGAADEPEWRETNVRFTGPAVRDLAAAFATAWVEATGELITGGEHLWEGEREGGEECTPAGGGARTHEEAVGIVWAGRSDGAANGDVAGGAGDIVTVEGDVVAGVLHSRPEIGSTAAERLLALSIVGARRTLYVANAYFVPGPELRKMLVEAAGRGVDVRILTAGAATDLPSVRHAARAEYTALLEAGVRIYELPERMMHAKTFVVDGTWSMIGSMNFDNRSLRLNDEVVLAAYDVRLGAAMDSLFLEDIARAEEIRLETFRERPWYERVLEQGSRLVWPFL